MNGKNKVDLNTVNERGQYLGGKWGQFQAKITPTSESSIEAAKISGRG